VGIKCTDLSLDDKTLLGANSFNVVHRPHLRLLFVIGRFNFMNMSNLAVKIAVIESETGWGRKIDDWMVCLSTEDAKAFEKEFNAENKSSSAPDWYMQVEGEPKPIDLTNKQFSKLQEDKRVWLSVLNAL
jgi:hypothetical protein